MNQLRLPSIDSARPKATLALALLLACVASCGGGDLRVSQSGFAVGSVHDNPDADAPSAQFVVDANAGGAATALTLKTVYWGRLVDIEDGSGSVTARDVVIGDGISTNSIYLFSTNPVTDRTTVRIRDHLAGSQAYLDAYRELIRDSNLTLIADAGLNPVITIPFVPRNAALMLKFDDLVDRDTIDGLSVRVRVGYPPETPFLARVIPDYNHGDLADYDGDGELEFHTTRVIVDATVSGAEAQGTDLPVNSLGFPQSITLGQSNLELRIPTETDPEANQTDVLRNPTGHAVSRQSSGTHDPSTTTFDVVRALRSGGPESITGDPSNGFLSDPDSPSVLGTQPVVIGTTITEVPGFPGRFQTTLDYAFAPCANPLRDGDVIQQTVEGCVVYAEVICPPGELCSADQAATGAIVGSTLNDVYFQYLRTSEDECSDQEFEPGQIAQVGVRFTSTLHAGREACFVSFSSIGAPPDNNVAPDATISVRFSEPMDPTSLRAFDTLFVTDVQTAPVYKNFVVGRITPSTDLREFKFRPVLPLRHTVGSNEAYFVTLLAPATGQSGASDLAGNPLLETFGTLRFRLDPSTPTENTAGFAYRFDRQDMIPGTDDPPAAGDPDLASFGFPEFRGQFLIDSKSQIVRPRPVTRFQAAADRTQSVPSIMAPFPLGVQTPISRYGSKLQTIWRYCDVGFALLDEQFYNVDVEHLYWSPAGGAVITDNIPRFEISLTHTNRLPDETLDPNLLPNFPNSGLVTTYSTNLLDAVNDPLRTVHPGANGLPGYVLLPINATVTTTGTPVMPWPLNFGITPDRFTYFTWRNTAVLAKGGLPDSPGAELPIVIIVNGLPPPAAAGSPYGPSNVPTVGLPILMEFRCYPNEAISGQNSFDISLATASSARPNFRAFSTGGLSTQGFVTKDPDLETVADGGYNPNSAPTPGASTLPADNSFYIGAMDLVVRVSRMHSIWRDSGSSVVRYQEPVLEPTAADQPAGTLIELGFRGATLVTNTAALNNADLLDVYGEVGTTPQPTFFQNDRTWRSTMAAISSPDGVQVGGKFFQVRVSFISNAATNLTPTLSAMGFAWRR